MEYFSVKELKKKGLKKLVKMSKLAKEDQLVQI
jgi:hypothetical protein